VTHAPPLDVDDATALTPPTALYSDCVFFDL